MSVEKIQLLHDDYIRLTERFKALWTFNQFLRGVYKTFFSSEPGYKLDFNALYEEIRAVAAQMNTSLPEAVAPRLRELWDKLDAFAHELRETDRRVSPSFVRRFFEKVRPQDEKIAFHLLRFYFSQAEVDEDVIDKVDFLATVAATGRADPEASLTRPRVAIQKLFESVTAASVWPRLESGMTPPIVRAFDELATDMNRAREFEDLVSERLLNNVRTMKRRVDLVSLDGHTPGGVYGPPGFSTLLAAAGPMARSADDLEAGLRILAGPEAPESKAFQWTLPAPRQHELGDFRVGYLLEDPAAPVSVETKSVLESAVRACERAGATVKEGWPEGFRFQEQLDTYFFLLGSIIFSLTPPAQRTYAQAQLKTRPEQLVKGALSGFADWQQENMKRLAYRAMWDRYFESVDVFLLPTTFTTAFAHDHTHPDQRTIPLPEGGVQPFWNFLNYITPATVTGCPATTAPVGLSPSALPVGLQIVGPYLEDATPIAFARLLAQGDRRLPAAQRLRTLDSLPCRSHRGIPATSVRIL